MIKLSEEESMDQTVEPEVVVRVGVEHVLSERIRKLDAETMGAENWILGRLPRRFPFLQYTSGQERVVFALDYFHWLTVKRLTSLMKALGQKFSRHEVRNLQRNEEYWNKLENVEYSERRTWCLEWWNKHSSHFASLSTTAEGKYICEYWIRDSILDAQELIFRTIVLPRAETEAKVQGLVNNPTNEKLFHFKEQDSVVREK